MKSQIKKPLSFIIIFFILSCSSYSVKTDIKDNSSLKKIKNAGVIFRISKGSKITKQESTENLLYWLSVYEKKRNVKVIADAGDQLTYFQNPQQRFYQLSNENEYLSYKSMGVLNLYLQNNQNELLNIISKNNLDGIIIFEVFCVISTQMQFFEFESVVAVADSNLNIAYLDHQIDYFESQSSSLNDLKNQAMDKINDRLMERLHNMDFLGGKTEGERKIIAKPVEISKPAEKKPEKTTEKPVEKQAEKKAEKPAEKTSEQPAEKKPEKKINSTIEKSPESAIKPVEKPAEKPQETHKDIKTEIKTRDTSEASSIITAPTQETK
ncbi:MAG: hypothetical protein V1874_08425 [Spirochaetota bacterium]